MRAKVPISIGAIYAEISRGVSRVWTDVDGQTLWFESADAELCPAPEAFAGALLLPAVTQHRGLTVDAPVNAGWQANLPAAMRLFRRWWQYPEIPLTMHAATSDAASRVSRTGLCFSGGVDSFFSLLRYQPPVEVLVYVFDYDIPIRGHSRPPQFEPWLRRLSERAGVQAVVVRTNLKRHPVFRDVWWYAAHGACLAAVGHLLSGLIGTLVLSSSFPRTEPHPSGTHFELDPLWSSSRLECVHFGDVLSRSQKLREIAHEPLVREFLRICWENLADRPNCGVCEKCVRTQLILLQCGELMNYPMFRHDVPLVERITRIGKAKMPALAEVYEELVRVGLPLKLEQAVTDLIGRMRRHSAPRPGRGVLRHLADRLCGLATAPRAAAAGRIST